MTGTIRPKIPQCASPTTERGSTYRKFRGVCSSSSTSKDGEESKSGELHDADSMHVVLCKITAVRNKVIKGVFDLTTFLPLDKDSAKIIAWCQEGELTGGGNHHFVIVNDPDKRSKQPKCFNFGEKSRKTTKLDNVRSTMVNIQTFSLESLIFDSHKLQLYIQSGESSSPRRNRKCMVCVHFIE